MNNKPKEQTCTMQLSRDCKKKRGVWLLKDYYTPVNTEFFASGRVHICKSCLREYIYDKKGNVKIDRFKKVLMLMNYPFFTQELHTALDQESDFLGVYMKAVYLNHKGKSWEDGEIKNSKFFNGHKEDSIENISDETIIFWGRGYGGEEYNFLNDYYDNLISMYDHSLPVQVNNYRNMAKTQLEANKCLEKNDITNYDKLMKVLSTLSGDSNIKPNQETSIGNQTKGGFDIFIKNIEDNEPILDWEEDLGNIDKLKSMLSVFFFGHFAKVLNINNPHQAEYDEEMRKYTVEEEHEEEDSEPVDFLGDI